MKRHSTLLLAVAFALTLTGHAHALDYMCKPVDGGWSWFGDHVATSVTYLVVGPPGRSYDTGTGVFFRGRPWGSKEVRSGNSKLGA